MGYGSYSYSDRSTRAAREGYDTKSTREIFSNRNINSSMNPYGIRIRESRDSNEHPNSYPIIIALDVTGSMGSVPHYLVKEGLPYIMKSIMEKGISDPQVLFLGIGDHIVDDAPLQVGQFESNDELLDKWLTDIWLEGGGGGNAGESYFLAWYFAAFHTSIDSFEKRNKKGILFTIGDEPVLNEINSRDINFITGDSVEKSYSAVELLDEASKTYDVFHIHIGETASGSREFVKNGWKEILSDNTIIAERREKVSDIMIEKIISTYGNKTTLNEKEDVLNKEIINKKGKGKNRKKEDNPSISNISIDDMML